MTDVQRKLARKYAQAFLHASEQQFTQVIYTQIKNSVPCIYQSTLYLNLLTYIHMDQTQKEAFFLRWLEHCNLPELLKPLGTLLVEQQRLVLLPEIVQQILSLYQEKNNILECTIESSESLESASQKVIHDFLKASTGKHIIPHFIVEPKLIAGIRITSKTLLWEYSLAQQLRQIKNFYHRMKG